MIDYEYMRVQYDLIPDEIKQQYELDKIVDKGYAYLEIQTGMYGLLLAGWIVHNQLKIHLAKYGYAPVQHTPGLWKHQTRNITFCLFVDNFGIKYTDKNNVEHLLNALQQLYTISANWSGTLFCDIHLAWDYVGRHIYLSMPGYIKATLHKYQHPPPRQPEHLPHQFEVPKFSKQPQYAPTPVISDPLNNDEKKCLQGLLETLLYYARAVDPTMLIAINVIAAWQANPTINIAKDMVNLLNYCSMHPNAVLC
eukprot:15365967-Ditylum_brightwellii.AAC.2